MAGFAEVLRQAGVLGAGGAGFPTYRKLSAKAEVVIANGAECEPMLHKDQALMAGRAAEVIDGLRKAMVAVGAAKGYLAVKEKHGAVIEALRRVSAGDAGIELHPLPDIYPAGDEVVLIYETTARVVPPGALPGTVGVLVDNVETLFNVSRACEGEPVTGKYVTVTGRVKRPATMRLPIGTSLADALRIAGGPLDDEYVMLVDGPMMGALAESPEQPVTKTTSALIVLPAGHHLVMAKRKEMAQIVRLARSACVSCTYCTETCPRRLLGHPIQPHLIMRAIAYNPLPVRGGEYGEPLAAVYRSARYCAACGTCNVICPMGLQPQAVCAYIKRAIPPDGKASASMDRTEPLAAREGRRMPTSRLYQRLGLDAFQGLHPSLVDEAEAAVSRVRLLLRQGIGDPAKPIVRPGQAVKKGEPVAEPPDGLGVALHASIDGTITEVTTGEVVIERSRGSG